MRAVVLSCLVLAGCASAPEPLPVLSLQEAEQMSAAQLCLGVSTFRPHNATVAQVAIERRGINCQDHAVAVQGLQQQRAQAAQAMQQQMLNRPVYQPYQLPTPAPIPRQQSCTSYRIGNTIQTDCR